MVPLYCYRNSHPVNLGLLALWVSFRYFCKLLYPFYYVVPTLLEDCLLQTASISLVVGVACSLYSGKVDRFPSAPLPYLTSLLFRCTGPVILEALLLTAVVVVSLTAYTFWASKQGHDFRQAQLLSLLSNDIWNMEYLTLISCTLFCCSFLGPILFSSLMILTVWGFIQIFLQPGPLGQ